MSTPPDPPVSFGSQVFTDPQGVTVTPRRVRRRAGCLLGPLGLVIFFSLMIGLVAAVIGIWPGSMKLTAPFLCPSGFDDPFVVSDTYNVRPGETSTTFTMYCLNERGEAKNVGAFRPGFLVFVFMCLLVIVPSVLIFLVKRIIRPPDRPAAP